jgi:alkanesulfonate monooxygenase SsuD/methylene tetrahydromethanopterin reductase-like flavin-dependent oxidoreductase (luciferase family)
MAPPLLGLILPQFATGPGPALAAMEDAARLGYAGVFLFDHLWPLGGPREAPILECWTLLGALAARLGTLPGHRPRLGTLVTRAGLRPPAVVAHMAATAGQAAGAPLITGIGGGDRLNRDENLAFGLPYPDRAGRQRATARLLEALAGPEAGDPRPVTWVGGRGPAARALAGRADGWNAWAATPDELAAGLADVRRAAEAAGRDPGKVMGTWGGQVLVDADGDRARARLAGWGSGRDPGETARVVAGDPGTVLGALATLGEAGASWCVLTLVGGDAGRARSLLARAANLSACPPYGAGD